jgi:pimeloyl-ACP methyl ester carboxylesterase
MRIVLVFIANLLCLASWSQYQIGHTTITFNDPSRTGGFGSGGGAGRQIQTEIYYPADVGGDNVALANDTFPVIVFGHGFAMAWDAYNNIWEHYAPMGYILAFPRTEGGLFPGPDHGDFGLDLALVGERMQQENTNSGSIFFNGVAQSTAIAGHSMGGGASVLAASGNSSIKTYVGLAPAETNPSAISAANAVTVPSLIFSGSQDGVTPPGDHHLPIYSGLGSNCKLFVNIEGGAHCYFANTNFNCDFGETTSSSGISITRQEQQDRTFAILDPWFEYTLKANCGGLDSALDIAANTPSFYSSQTTCSPIGSAILLDNSGIFNPSITGDAYQWYQDGIVLPGETNYTYTPTVNGVYQVAVLHSSGCWIYSNEYEVTTLSISELNSSKLSVVPNPAIDAIEINGLKTGDSYAISTADGRIYLKGTYNGQILINTLASGVYFLEAGRSMTRFIVR